MNNIVVMAEGSADRPFSYHIRVGTAEFYASRVWGGETSPLHQCWDWKPKAQKHAQRLWLPCADVVKHLVAMSVRHEPQVPNMVGPTPYEREQNRKADLAHLYAQCRGITYNNAVMDIAMAIQLSEYKATGFAPDINQALAEVRATRP